VSESVSASISIGPSLGVASTDSVSVLVVRGPWLVSEVGVVVANTESVLEVVSVVSELGSSVGMSISTAESASVTTAGEANSSISLVIPVVGVILVGVWVLESVWSPGEVIGTINLSVMVIESLNITWLVVTVTPESVVVVLSGLSSSASSKD